MATPTYTPPKGWLLKKLEPVSATTAEDYSPLGGSAGIPSYPPVGAWVATIVEIALTQRNPSKANTSGLRHAVKEVWLKDGKILAEQVTSYTDQLPPQLIDVALAAPPKPIPAPPPPKSLPPPIPAPTPPARSRGVWWAIAALVIGALAS